MKEIELDVKRTGQQRKAWVALANNVVRRVLYGGAKGGGKSWLLCVWLFTMVYAIMVMAKLKPSKNPPHVAWFGRKQAVDLTGTTLQTWREVIPEEYYKLRGATERDPKHILIADRIAIDYGGLDKQENIQKFNSAEYIIIAIDQAEEVNKDDIAVLRGSLRMVLKGTDGKPLKIPFKELYTANPRQCWLKDDFILNPTDRSRFIRALPTDNPHLPSDYIQTLEEAFGHRPDLLKAYRDGDWDAFEGDDQVILGKWITTAMARRPDFWPYIKEFIVIDSARFGDDETVIVLMNNTDIREKIVMPHTRTTDISGRAASLSYQNGKCPIVVESTGSDLGAGVIDELIEMGHDTLQFNPAAASSEPKEFYSLRCEGWHNLAKMLARGTTDKEDGISICLTKHDPERVSGEDNYGMDTTMWGQLCTPHYKWRKGKLVVEPKDETKKRLGRSPDHGDVYMIAMWAFPRMPIKEEKKTKYFEHARKTVGSAMDCG